jgi:sulfate/thiosulfate transport system substrate-binding protein
MNLLAFISSLITAVPVVAALATLGGPRVAQGKPITILNVSYDPTRELYREINAAFAAQWRAMKGQTVQVLQSHGGSAKQARAVIDGLEADVVTLALPLDIDAIAERSGLVPADWASRLPHNSAPFASTIVMLVRRGNPKHVRDWNDLARPGIGVITSNPKTSGGARLNYLALWAYASKTFAGNQAKTQDFVRRVFANVPVLDAGARAATATFVERGIGDVLITWENDALLARRQFADTHLEVVVPSLSLLAEPPVAVVEKVAARHGTLDVSRAYLDFLYSDAAQEIAARNFYRPTKASVARRYAAQFAPMHLLTVDSAFGGWRNAQAVHFADDGTFDRIYEPRP